MKLLLNSIIKCFFYSQYSNDLLDFDIDNIKSFVKILNKKLLKENFILFIEDLLNKLDKSYISLTKFNNNFYLKKIIKKIKSPNYLLIDNNKIIIDVLKKSSSIEKKFNITSKFNNYDNNILLFNNNKYKLDSYITDDNSYYITKNNKLSLRKFKSYKLLIYVLISNDNDNDNDNDNNESNDNDNNESNDNDNDESNDNNNSKSNGIKKIKMMIKKKEELIKTLDNKIDINKLKIEIKQYNDILLTIKKKLTKKDYINLIKKNYPYYGYLDKYPLEQLKQIYNRKCNNIDIYYDGNNSCYIDSLMVALFNKKNPIIEEILFNASIKDYNNDNLKLIGADIKKELFKLYKKISLQDVNEDINKCINLRKLFQDYITIYRKKVNRKYDKIEWTTSQNDYTDILIFLQIIFNIPDTLKYSRNNIIENRYFLDVFPLDLFLNAYDVLYIKDYYPKYTSTFSYISDDNIERDYTNKIEYLSTPLLFIQFNRIYNDEKLETKIIPILKLKLKENKYPLYLNAILIQQYGTVDFGHYICLYECNNIWYEFDDLKRKNIKIGSFNKILENDNYTRNITGLYYV
jgi:hypothetical protein